MPASESPPPIDPAGFIKANGLNPQTSLAKGCYLIEITLDQQPADQGRWIGTLRVDWRSGRLTVSGDLYVFQPGIDPPDPAAGIPSFEHVRYSNFLHGLRLSKASGQAGGLRLRLGRQRLDHETNRWVAQLALELTLRSDANPDGWPEDTAYWTGKVDDLHGNSLGHVAVGWLSSTFRKAQLEISHVPEAPIPLGNGDDYDWARVFAEVDWEMAVSVGASNLVKSDTSTDSWSKAELHETMLNWHKKTEDDSTWRFYLACVKDVDASGARGFMFDGAGSDSKNMPRRGAAIESGWYLPETDGPWAAYRENLGISSQARVSYGESPILYFRTAAHEIGHTMGLCHSGGDFLMNVTDDLASNGKNRFPTNVCFRFTPENEHLLRHWPDPYVRPEGVSLNIGNVHDGLNSTSPDHEIRLEAHPLNSEVPLGAPVRIRFVVTSLAKGSVNIPSLSLKSGQVSGRVVGPGGEERPLRSIMLWLDGRNTSTTLAKRTSTSHWITLLRGAKGALFPAPGLYRIIVELRRERPDGAVAVSTGETQILVTSEGSRKHARIVRHILTTPDTLLVLAFGGRHLKDGVKAIKAALSDDVLRPHFGVIEAKRRGGLGQSPKRILKVLDKRTVMSAAELRRIADLVHSRWEKAEAKKDLTKKKTYRKLLKLLRYHAKKLRIFNEDLKEEIATLFEK